VLARVLGRPVQFVDVAPGAAKAGMLQGGMPAGYVDALIELLATIKAGATDGVTPVVEQLLGRAPATFESWVRRNAGAFM
jgi:hypothetical protein